MIQDQQLLEEFHTLSPEKQEEVVDFIAFLKIRSQKKPAPKNKKRGLYGVLKGKIWMSEDFDEPLDDFEPYMA